MKTEPTLDHAKFIVPADLDPSRAGAVHSDLVRTLEQAAGAVVLTLDGEGPPSPLTLQLLVSAGKSRSAAEVSFCERARASLAEVDTKEGVLT